jgi:hypothetical protein
VISGTFNIGAGDTFDPEKTTALPAGRVSIMEAKTNHFARTKEETIVQLNGEGPWGITYVNPADDRARNSVVLDCEPRRIGLTTLASGFQSGVDHTMRSRHLDAPDLIRGLSVLHGIALVEDHGRRRLRKSVITV